MTVTHCEVALLSPDMSKPLKDKRNITSAFSTDDATEHKVLSKMCFDSASLGKINPLHDANRSLSEASSPCLSKCSRYGRDSQRWDGDIRLVTGAVPVTKNGEILMCSAAGKKQWIFPKGGWETDESLEEGAKREAFEEAGVLGELGPRLTAITFETRKSKKSRLEAYAEETGFCGESAASSLGAVNECGNMSDTACNSSTVSSEGFDKSQNVIVGKLPLPLFEQFPRTPGDMYSFSSGSISSCEDEKSANRSHIRNARLCRITLFPLYVSNVLEDWPESGRVRKVLSIDDAIEEITRPEMRSALLEMKERGLQHIS